MKIITNTVESESLNNEISDSDLGLNTETVAMKDMEGKLQSLNGEVTDKRYLSKLETDQIKKVSNGITNGFKVSSDKSTTLNNKSTDFDEISDDDFHLELEDSDEENREKIVEIIDRTNQSANLNVEVLSPKTTDLEKNSTSSESNIVGEIEDTLGVDETELVSKDLITSESMTVVESDHVVQLDSLLDCEEPTKTCLNDEQKTEETTDDKCTYALEPSNSENTDEAIEVDDVFSEVVIENDETDANSEKTKDTDVEEKLRVSDLVNSKEEKMFEDIAETKTVGTHLDESEKCISENNFESSMEVDCDINKPSVLEKSFSGTSSDTLLKPISSTTLDISNDLVLPVVINSVGYSDAVKNVAETTLDATVVNQNEEPKVVDVNESDSEEITTIDIDTEEKPLENFVNINTKEDTVSLGTDFKTQNVDSVKTKLTKSPSGDEIYLNDVMESVVENFEEQKNSFDDNDFEDMDLAAPIQEVNSSNERKFIKTKQSVSSSQESGSTVNNPDEWMVLDELNGSFSSSEEQTDRTSENINSLSGEASCEIQDGHELQITESDSIHTDVCFTDDIEIEETEIEKVEESSTAAIEQLVSLKDANTVSECEDVTKMDVETSIPKNDFNEEIITTVEESGLKVVDSITLSDEINLHDSHEQIIILNNEESNNVSVAEGGSKEIDPIVLNNEEVDIEFEEFGSKDIDSNELKDVDNGSNMDVEVSTLDDETKNNIQINESDINVSGPAVPSNEIDSEKVTEKIIVLSKEEFENNLVNDSEDVTVDSKNVSLDNSKEETIIDIETVESSLKPGEDVTVDSKNVSLDNSKEETIVDIETVESSSKPGEDVTVDSKNVSLDNSKEETIVYIETVESSSKPGEDVTVDSKNVSLDNSKEETIVDIEAVESPSKPGESLEPTDSDCQIKLVDELGDTTSDAVGIEDSSGQESLVLLEKDDKSDLECMMSIEENFSTSLEVEKNVKNEESEQSNKEIQLETLESKQSNTVSPDDNISLSETTKNTKEDISDALRKRSASSDFGDDEGAETKKFKHEVEKSLLKEEIDALSISNECNMDENDIEITPSKLKRANSDTELTSDLVKKPKLNSNGETDLSVCCDVVEQCLKFAETDNSISVNLKEPLVNVDLDKDNACVKDVPEVSDSSDSVSDIKNSLTSSNETIESDNSDISKSSNNKFRRKDVLDLESKADVDGSKKISVPNKSTEEKIPPKTITNLDLAIERVVEQSRVDLAKKIPILQRFHKDQLKNLTRHDLEELVIVKLCEAITDRSVIGELRLRCHKVEQIHDQWKKKAMQLEKSHRELEMVLKRYLLEASNTKKERQPLPIKVTRSVGLQVVLASSPHVPRQKSSSHSQQSSQHHRKQMSGSNRVPNSSTPKPPPTTVSGPGKSSKPSLNQALPQQKQSGIRVLTPKTNQVDPLTPVKTPVPSPRSRPSISTPAPTPSPKAGSLEVIDLTDKEEKNKQLQQKQQQLAQQQKLKQQLILQQQQQKQKQQILQQKQQQQKQLLQQSHQVKQMAQQKQPAPIQNTTNKPLQQQKQPPQQQQKQQPPQQNVGVRVPTSVQQNGIRLVQAHQLTTNSPTQSIQAILVPTSTGQNGTTRPPQLFIATPTANQIRATTMPVIQPNRQANSATPISINGNSTVMLRAGHVIPLQQTAAGVLRSPPAALPIMNRTGIQQIRPPQPVFKHPAPLPLNTQYAIKPGMNLPPPKPQLKIAKTVNGIMLSWSMAIAKDVADIASYQLYAYQESSQPPNTALWKKVGDVKALPLPMACTLTQFVEGHKYHFSVRAVDVHSRIGPFSVPGSILLTSGK